MLWKGRASRDLAQQFAEGPRCHRDEAAADISFQKWNFYLPTFHSWTPSGLVTGCYGDCSDGLSPPHKQSVISVDFGLGRWISESRAKAHHLSLYLTSHAREPQKGPPASGRAPRRAPSDGCRLSFGSTNSAPDGRIWCPSKCRMYWSVFYSINAKALSANVSSEG